MKKKFSPRLFFSTISILILTLLSAIVINVLTSDPEFNWWLKDYYGIGTKHLVVGTASIGFFLILFTYFQFKYAGEDTDEPLSENVEPDIKRLHRAVKEQYLKRYKSKLDGRFEIRLEVSEDWSVDKPKRYKFDAEAKVSNAVDAVKEAFKDQGGLLIVGSPGSGKTVLLLKLADELLHDEYIANQKLPIVFNLATWSAKYTNFEDWLIEILNSNLGLSKEFAKTLLEENRIVFLLDGLDELSRNEDAYTANRIRAKCLDSLNSYLREGRKAVICCRRDEFAEMQRMTSQDAPVSAKVEVLDLTKADIFLALREAQEYDESRVSAKHLEEIIENDDVFLEILCTPFYFTTALEVFDKYSLKETDFPTNTAEIKKHLIDRFIESKINHTRSLTKFVKDKADIQKWLEWLACLMETKHLVTFELANLQSRDLKKKWLLGLIHGLVYGLLYALLYALLNGLINGFIVGYNVHMIYILAVGLFGGLGSGLVGNNIYAGETKVSMVWKFLNPNYWKKALVFGLVSGLVFGSVTLIKGDYTFSLFLTSVLVNGLGDALVYALILSLLSNNTYAEGTIRLNFGEILSLTYWKQVLFFTLIVGLLSGLVGGLPLFFLISTDEAVRYFIISGVLYGTIFGLFFSVEKLKNIERVTHLNNPYQKIYRGVLINLMSCFLILFSTIGISSIAAEGLFSGNISDRLLIGAVYLAIPAVQFLILKNTVFVHFCLRLCFYIEKSIPLKYAHFLDAASEARILEKDGGQWRFRHQNLQEHLAQSEKN